MSECDKILYCMEWWNKGLLVIICALERLDS